MLISSHILSDLEDICTRIIFIADGSNVQQPEAAAGGTLGPVVVYEIEILPAPQAREVAAAIPDVEVLHASEGSLHLAITGGREQIAGVVKVLAAAGVGITRVQPAASLESQYQRLFGANP